MRVANCPLQPATPHNLLPRKSRRHITRLFRGRRHRTKYSYDFQNRLVRKVLDSDGDGTTDSSTVFVSDGSQVALQFDHAGTGSAAASDLSHRYLWGRAVDQLLADESVADLQTPGDVLWPLVDHLNTVRDLATYGSQQDETTIANHRMFDAYGRLTDESNAAVDCLFAFTGRMFDEDTDLQNNLNRWYDPVVGRWLSEDPIGYEGGINLYEYVGDNPLTQTDPNGQFPYWYDEAMRRQGRGPWGYSAAHCWAACWFGATIGLGNLAAIGADLGEILTPWGDDNWRDMKAQHYGGWKGNQYNWGRGPWDWFIGCPGPTVEEYCDIVCET